MLSETTFLLTLIFGSVPNIGERLQIKDWDASDRERTPYHGNTTRKNLDKHACP